MAQLDEHPTSDQQVAGSGFQVPSSEKVGIK